MTEFANERSSGTVTLKRAEIGRVDTRAVFTRIGEARDFDLTGSASATVLAGALKVRGFDGTDAESVHVQVDSKVEVELCESVEIGTGAAVTRGSKFAAVTDVAELAEE